MRKALWPYIIGICVAACCSSGCSPKWAPNSEPIAQAPRWLDDAGRSRAVLSETITGFQESGITLPNLLRSIAFGNRSSENALQGPTAVAVGDDRRIAIADTAAACVHLYIPAEKAYRKIQTFGREGLRTPVGVIFDDALHLYVSDSTRQMIAIYDANGQYLSSITKAGDAVFKRPTGLAYSSRLRRLYVVDTAANTVYTLSTAGELIRSFGGTGEQNGQFNMPTHIAIADDERVYVTDALNFRIQVFNESGEFLRAFGRHGNGSGDFARPKGIAVDADGTIYVVDTLFDNIQLFDLGGRFLFTIGSRGGGPGELMLPSGLFLDRFGRLYACDTFGRRVHIFQLIHEGTP